MNGFYYDSELKSSLLVASLHPNMRPLIEKNYDVPAHIPGVPVEKIVWVDLETKRASNQRECFGDDMSPIFTPEDEDDRNQNETYVQGGEPNKPYSKEPLCSAIMENDFSVSVCNNWSEVGGDAISGAWNNLRTYTPYFNQLKRSRLGERVAEGASKATEFIKEKTDVTPDKDDGLIKSAIKGIAGAIHRGVEFLENNSSELLNHANSAIMVTGARFIYYTGTSIDFTSNLSMRFTLFSEVDSELGKFVPVTWKVIRILPYVIGDVEKPNFTTVGGQGIVNDGDPLDNYIFWQNPPAGFSPNTRDIDSTNSGTMKLRLGNLYAIDNLVIQTAQFNFSKVMCKCPITKEGKIDLSYIETKKHYSTGNCNIEAYVPLYCDIVLNLIPITKFSRNSIERFISGAGVRTAYKEMNKKIIDGLNPQNSKDFNTSGTIPRYTMKDKYGSLENIPGIESLYMNQIETPELDIEPDPLILKPREIPQVPQITDKYEIEIPNSGEYWMNNYNPPEQSNQYWGNGKMLWEDDGG